MAGRRKVVVTLECKKGSATEVLIDFFGPQPDIAALIRKAQKLDRVSTVDASVGGLTLILRLTPYASASRVIARQVIEKMLRDLDLQLVGRIQEV